MTKTNILVDFLQSLRDTTKSISEGTANKQSSESLEDTFQKILSSGGLTDLTDELKKCQLGQDSVFSSATTKRARQNRFHVIKDYIKDIGPLESRAIRQDSKNMFPANCFIRHPCGPGDKPDFLVIINGNMLYWEMKTSKAGFHGKLNDKPIPAQSFILCSSGNKKLDCPFTWFQVADMYNEETWVYYNTVLPLLKKFRNDLRSSTNSLYTDNVKKCASEISLRGIVGWGNKNNDWYRKDFNGLSRADREQRVIDLVNPL
jgi:hypothetical protein